MTGKRVALFKTRQTSQRLFFGLGSRQFAGLISGLISGLTGAACAALMFCLCSCVAHVDTAGAGSSGNSFQSGETAFESGACGSVVRYDYNDVVSKCKYRSSPEEDFICISSAQSFQNKYPGINCAASTYNPVTMSDSTVVITHDTLQNKIDRVTAHAE